MWFLNFYGFILIEECSNCNLFLVDKTHQSYQFLKIDDWFIYFESSIIHYGLFSFDYLRLTSQWETVTYKFGCFLFLFIMSFETKSRFENIFLDLNVTVILCFERTLAILSDTVEIRYWYISIFINYKGIYFVFFSYICLSML